MSSATAKVRLNKAPPLAQLRFAVMSPGKAEIAFRAMEIPKAINLPLDACAVADTVTVGSTANADLMKAQPTSDD